MILFHGGPAGLTEILPPRVTGAVMSTGAIRPDLATADRVYLTSDERAARFFAAMAPARNVCVYEVEPLGDLEHDPDCNEPGLSYAAPSARVIRAFPLSASARNRILRAAGVSLR